MTHISADVAFFCQDTPSSGPDSAPPLTVNKTVLNLEIPLHNSGPAGLGVTVYTKSTSSKVGGEMGVYIKSIVPGGAAAMVRKTTPTNRLATPIMIIIMG